MRLKTLLFCAAAAILGGGLPARAAIFPSLTVEQLTAQSQVILQGNIVRSWTAWDREHKYIWTHYEVSITEAIRGSASSSFTISEPGGDLDGVHQRFSGAVAYAPGESAFLFLYKTPIGYWRAVGGPQGKFHIEADGRVRADGQADILASVVGRPPSGTPLTALNGIEAADFKNRVRRLAATYPFRAQ